MVKKILGITLCLMAVAAFMVPTMARADAWYVCTVSGVGKDNAGNLKFGLTEVGGRFTNQLCRIADAAQSSHYMALMISAQVMTINVGVCTLAAIPVGGGPTATVTCAYLME